MHYRKDRNQQNYENREKRKQEHFLARIALEQFRENGDCRRFPDLNRRAGGIHGLSLAGYCDEEVSPPLTQEEFDRFKAAYDASDEGKKANAEFDDWWKKIREQ